MTKNTHDRVQFRPALGQLRAYGMSKPVSADCGFAVMIDKPGQRAELVQWSLHQVVWRNPPAAAIEGISNNFASPIVPDRSVIGFQTASDHLAQCRGSVIVERNKALPHRVNAGVKLGRGAAQNWATLGLRGTRAVGGGQSAALSM